MGVEAAAGLAVCHREGRGAFNARIVAQEVRNRRRRGRVVGGADSPPVLLSDHVVGDEIGLRCNNEVALTRVVDFAFLDESAQGIVEDVLTGNSYS